MAEQLFDKYSDLQALEQETNKILSYFNQVKEGVKELSTMGVKLDMSKGMAELNNAQKDLQKLTDQLLAANQKLQKAEADLAAKRAALAEQSKKAADANKQHADSVRELSSELSDNIVRQNTLKDRLKDVQAALKNLNGFKEAAKNSKEFQAELQRLGTEEVLLRAEIANTNKFIKKQGEEAVAAEGSLDALRARLGQMLLAYDAFTDEKKATPFGKEALKSIQDLTAEISKQEQATKRFQRNVGNYQGSAKLIVEAFEKAQQRVTKFAEEGGKVGPEIASARQEVEVLGRVLDSGAFVNMSSKIGDATAETKFLTRALKDAEAGGLKNSTVVAELKNRLAELTDQQSDLRQEIKAMSSDTRSFDLVSSSVTTMTNAVQGAVGIQALFGETSEDVQKSIQKLVAIENAANGIRGIANDLTTRGSAANKAYAFVQRQVAVATAATTTGLNRFKAALALSGIGLLVIALGFAAEKMGLFGSETESADEALENMNKTLERQNELLTDQARKIDTAGKLRMQQLKIAGASEVRLTAESIAILAKQAMARDKEARGQLNMIKKVTDAYGLQVQTKDQALKAMDFLEQRGFKAEAAALKSVSKLYEEAEDFRTQIKLANGETRIKSVEKERTAAEKAADAEGKAGSQLRQMLLEQLADREKTISDFEFASRKKREDATNAEFEYRRKAILEGMNFELSAADLTLSQRLLIEAKAEQDIDKLREGRNQKLSQILTDEIRIRQQFTDDAIAEANRMQQQNADAVQGEIDFVVDQMNEFTDKAQIAYDNQRAALAKKFKDGIITQEEYNTQSEKIEADYQRNILENQILFYERQLEILKASGANTIELEKAIAAARKKLVEDSIKPSKAEEEAAAERKKQAEDVAEAYKQLGATIQEAFTSIVGGTFDARKNELQEEIDLVEQLKNKDIERIAQSTDSEEKKAARIAIVNARAAAQKESLERRQRQLDEQKARFERAMNIAAIIQNTARGVTAALASVPPNIPLSILVGAIGAVQLVQALATPIPKFKDGTFDSPAGLAIAGEAGRELAIEPTGNVKMFDKPTLTNLMKGTVIFPNAVTEDLLRAKDSDRLAIMQKFYDKVTPAKPINNRNEELLEEAVKQLSDLNKKSRIAIYNHPAVETDPYYLQQMKY